MRPHAWLLSKIYWLLAEIRSDNGLEAETCCPVDYTVVICVTVLSRNIYSLLVVCHYIRLYNQKKHHTDWEEQDISKDKKGLILKLLKQARRHAICSCRLYIPLTQLSAVSYSLNPLYFHWIYANKCNICYQEYFKTWMYLQCDISVDPFDITPASLLQRNSWDASFARPPWLVKYMFV